MGGRARVLIHQNSSIHATFARIAIPGNSLADSTKAREAHTFERPFKGADAGEAPSDQDAT
jgi:hypothetical protein